MNELAGRDTKPAEMSENMKRYKPLLSSAPEHSILNAQAFHYTNAVATDIRRTFARIRRERASAAVVVNLASRVRSVPTEGVRQLAAVALGYVHLSMTRRP